MTESVEDHLLQRRRCVESDDRQDLSTKTRELKQEWDKEYRDSINAKWHVGPETIDDWKHEEIGKTIAFPVMSNPAKPEFYESIFRPSQPATKVCSLHIDQYGTFVASIAHAEKYRLTARLPESNSYPIPKPLFPAFPAYRQDSSLKEPPQPPKRHRPAKWHEYFLVGRLISQSASYARALENYNKKKPAMERFNAWLTALQADRCLYYEEKKHEFQKTAAAITADWERHKHRWETAARADITKSENCVQGMNRTDHDIAKYFRTHLDSVPLLPCCDKSMRLSSQRGGNLQLN